MFLQKTLSSLSFQDFFSTFTCIKLNFEFVPRFYLCLDVQNASHLRMRMPYPCVFRTKKLVSVELQHYFQWIWLFSEHI